MTFSDGKASLFRSLHVKGTPLVLPNAWDVASARLVEAAGAAAVATTSAGVAWSLGAADGNRLDRSRAVDLVSRIAAAVDVPVTADVEGGYADTPGGVAETITAVVQAGAVGVNLEDSAPSGAAPLLPIADQCRRIAAARDAADTSGAGLFVNARTDAFLHGGTDPSALVADTLSRAAAYVEAGADGIYVIGVRDPDVVATLVAEIDAPVNILAGPGAPTVDELARLGVARVSVGPAIAEAAYAVAKAAAQELLTAGTYTTLAGALGFGELNTLLRGGPSEAASQ